MLLKPNIRDARMPHHLNTDEVSEKNLLQPGASIRLIICRYAKLHGFYYCFCRNYT